MSNLKHTKMGKVSFILALILLIYFMIITMKDIIFPISFSSEDTSRMSNILMEIEALILMVFSIISLILGIVARFQKESKKLLPTIAIIISGVLLIPFINVLIKVIIFYLYMGSPVKIIL